MHVPWLTLHLLRIVNNCILLFVHFLIHSFICSFIFLLLFVDSFLHSSQPFQLFCLLYKVNNNYYYCNIHFSRFCSWVTSFLNADLARVSRVMALTMIWLNFFFHLCLSSMYRSLGCILYELFVGTPPFYTNSIFQLVNLICRVWVVMTQITWTQWNKQIPA